MLFRTIQAISSQTTDSAATLQDFYPGPGNSRRAVGVVEVEEFFGHRDAAAQLEYAVELAQGVQRVGNFEQHGDAVSAIYA
jgi:hypothetical protein